MGSHFISINSTIDLGTGLPPLPTPPSPTHPSSPPSHPSAPPFDVGQYPGVPRYLYPGTCGARLYHTTRNTLHLFIEVMPHAQLHLCSRYFHLGSPYETFYVCTTQPNISVRMEALLPSVFVRRGFSQFLVIPHLQMCLRRYLCVCTCVCM
jgi:hypothetical protein